jgi:hypothetical protein
MILTSDDGGFRDAAISVGGMFFSMLFLLAALFVFIVNACSRQDKGIATACVAMIAIWFGGMWTVHHVAAGIWQADFDRNRTVVLDVIDELNRYVALTGETPESLAEIGIDEPIVLPLGGYDYELKYERLGGVNFKVSYSTGWYRNFYESETGTWHRQD